MKNAKRLLIALIFVANTIATPFKVLSQNEASLPKLTPKLINTFPASMLEVSGIISLNGKYYAIADGGNEASIFVLDNAFKLIETLNIDAKNIDFEDITSDGKSIYIGDFGNNKGQRKDLRILKINIDKSKLQHPIPIYFNYPQQTDYRPLKKCNAFDCEAFIYLNESFHLFTKNRHTNWPNHYVVSNKTVVEKESQKAVLLDSADVSGLITAACYVAKTKQMLLLGYTKKYAFLEVFNNVSDIDKAISGSHKRYSLGLLNNAGQTEGLCLDTSGKNLIITSEGNKEEGSPAKVSIISLSDIQ